MSPTTPTKTVSLSYLSRPAWGNENDRPHPHWLCRFLAWTAAGLALVLGVGVAVATGHLAGLAWSIVAGAGTALVVAALIGYSAAAFHRGYERAAMFRLAVVLLLASGAYILITPGAAAIVALLPIVLLALLIPNVRPGTFYPVLAVAGVATATLLALTAIWPRPDLLPPGLDLAVRIAGYVAILTIAVALLHRNHQVVHQALVQARAERDELQRTQHEMEKRHAALEQTQERPADPNVPRQEAQDDLEGDERAVLRFLNAAAHEMRTPMTPILMHLDVIRNDPKLDGQDRLSKSLDVIERNLERMKTTINELVDAAQVRADQYTFPTSDIPMAELFNDVEQTYAPIAEAKAIRFEIEKGEIIVRANPERIQQVLSTLVANALANSEPGGKIWVKATRMRTACLVQVIDTGKGLDAEECERIFEPFAPRQGKDVTARSGLGLYFSRSIVEGHGGQIECHSKGPGRGTTFRFTLPLAAKADHELEVQVARQHTRARARHPPDEHEKGDEDPHLTGHLRAGNPPANHDGPKAGTGAASRAQTEGRNPTPNRPPSQSRHQA